MEKKEDKTSTSNISRLLFNSVTQQLAFNSILKKYPKKNTHFPFGNIKISVGNQNPLKYKEKGENKGGLNIDVASKNDLNDVDNKEGNSSETNITKINFSPFSEISPALLPSNYIGKR